MIEYKQIYYRVFNEYSGLYESLESFQKKIEQQENLVPVNAKWVKIGVQAPPGTKMRINSQIILIGRSGTYELEGIDIQSFNFELEPIYQKSEEETNKKILEAQKYFNQCKAFYNQLVDTAEDEATFYKNWAEYYNGNLKREFYYNKNTNVYDFINTYEDEAWEKIIGYQGYLVAQNTYELGQYGVYIELKDQVTGEPIVKQLKNIVIDYIQEEGGSNG